MCRHRLNLTGADFVNWFFRKFLNVSLGFMSRNKPILTSVCDWNLFTFRNAKFSRRLSKMPKVSSCLNPYFSWDRVCVDYSLNVRYTHLVTAHVLMSRNMCSYAAPDDMSLLCVIPVFSEIMMTTVSSMVFIVSKIRWWTVAG